MDGFWWITHIHYLVLLALVLKLLPRIFNGYRFYGNPVFTLLAGSALCGVYLAVDALLRTAWNPLVAGISEDIALLGGFAAFVAAGALFIKAVSRVLPQIIPAISWKNAGLTALVLALTVVLGNGAQLVIRDMLTGSSSGSVQTNVETENVDR